MSYKGNSGLLFTEETLAGVKKKTERLQGLTVGTPFKALVPISLPHMVSSDHYSFLGNCPTTPPPSQYKH